jgi:hypothetical protein
MEAQQRLQAASSEYQKLQAQLQDTVDARARLGAQLTENEAVQAVRPPLPLIPRRPRLIAARRSSRSSRPGMTSSSSSGPCS